MPNNRELALFIWLAAILVAVVAYKKARPFLLDVLRLLLNPRILIPIFLLMVNATALVYLGLTTGLWSIALTSSTVIWFGGTALVLLFNISDSLKQRYFITRKVYEAMRLTLLLEFVTNLYVLSLLIELLLVPVLTLLSATSAYLRMQKRHQKVRTVADSLLTLIGLALITYATVRAVQDYKHVFTIDTLSALILPVWMTLGVLPFIFILGVYAAYEAKFSLMASPFLDRGPRSRRRAIAALAVEFRLSAVDVNNFTGPWLRRLVSADTWQAARAVVASYRDDVHDKEVQATEKMRRLERYANVKGTNEQGYQLDQREFEETKEALLWASTCHMGHHNDARGYRRDLLKNVLLNDFSRQGLPSEHGVEMRVASDGSWWYAWRRTITGWGFAIGANDVPPNLWKFDGPEPPSGPPGTDERWFNELDMPARATHW